MEGARERLDRDRLLASRGVCDRGLDLVQNCDADAGMLGER